MRGVVTQRYSGHLYRGYVSVLLPVTTERAMVFALSLSLEPRESTLCESSVSRTTSDPGHIERVGRQQQYTTRSPISRAADKPTQTKEMVMACWLRATAIADRRRAGKGGLKTNSLCFVWLRFIIVVNSVTFRRFLPSRGDSSTKPLVARSHLRPIY